MDKYFICLANSYKHGGRCIAGVELELKDSRWRIVRDDRGMPKWIRPVLRYSASGEIPNVIAIGISTLDVVCIEGVEACPVGAQVENVYFSNMYVTGKRYDASLKLLERFTDDSHLHIFYNYGKAVTPEIYQNLGTQSIILIHALDAEVYIKETYTDNPRYRVRFSYHSHVYDFPITDPDYIKDIRSGRKSVGCKQQLFITCSLGVKHEGWHPKLAACVFEVEHDAWDSSNIHPANFSYETHEGGTNENVVKETDNGISRFEWIVKWFRRR